MRSRTMGPIPLHLRSFDLVYLSKRLSTQSPPIFTENDLNDTTLAAAQACTGECFAIGLYFVIAAH
jgi:hypothetical protein